MACGATTPFNTQASLVSKGKFFSPKNTPAFLVLEDRQPLNVQWNAPSIVEISVPPKANPFKMENSVEGVTILYK
jgi:hypothetical protein